MKQKKRKILLVVIAGIAVVLIAFWFFVGQKKREADLDNLAQAGSLRIDARATTSQDKEEKSSPLFERKVYFSGMEDATIYPESVIQLDNRKENLDFWLKYEIYHTETGEKIFETDLIPSGQSVEWVPGETLAPGKYVLTFLQMPYYLTAQGEYIGLTQGSNQVTLAILD